MLPVLGASMGADYGFGFIHWARLFRVVWLKMWVSREQKRRRV